MAFDWREYLNLARFLAQGGYSFNQEAAFRCATSRAYFAAFCHARNYARDRLGFVPYYDWRDHGEVRNYFRNLNMVDTALMLDELRGWRNSCDYDDTVSNISWLLKSSIAGAHKVFKRLM